MTKRSEFQSFIFEKMKELADKTISDEEARGIATLAEAYVNDRRNDIEEQKNRLKQSQHILHILDTGRQLNMDVVDQQEGILIDYKAPMNGPFPGMVRTLIVQDTPLPKQISTEKPEFEPQEPEVSGAGN